MHGEGDQDTLQHGLVRYARLQQVFSHTSLDGVTMRNGQHGARDLHRLKTGVQVTWVPRAAHLVGCTDATQSPRRSLRLSLIVHQQ